MGNARANYDLFPAWCRSFDIPAPTREHRFDATRRWRFDFAWPFASGGGVALEIEGGLWKRGRHNRAPGMIADMEKYNSATVQGWRVLRVTPQQLITRNTIDLLRAAMEVRP